MKNKQKTEQTIHHLNWAVFIILLTSMVLFRLLFIFNITTINCIGYANYWLNTYPSGLSIFTGFILIYILCLVWLLLDIILIIAHNHKQQRRTSIAIPIILLFSACIFLAGTYKLYSMSPSIQFVEKESNWQISQDLIKKSKTTKKFSKCLTKIDFNFLD